jgi:hypothetical protein
MLRLVVKKLVSLVTSVTGGEGGILSPPFLLSSCHPCTFAIIRYILAGYNGFRTQATVSIASPIPCSSAETGISGIS